MDYKFIIITLIVLLLVLLITAVVLQFSITGKVIYNQDYYKTFTKAICNSSGFCQDYIYTCKNNETINIQPITGAVIQLPEDYNSNISNKTC